MDKTIVENDSKIKLHIQLLDGFAVFVDGDKIPDGQWKSRRASNLVKLLALAPGHRMHRDQVVDTLWPDSDLAAAVNNFHQTLYVARHVLGKDGKDCLVLKDDFLSLGGIIAVDVEQFESAAARAGASQDLAGIQEALEEYTGDLLPEDVYEEWTIERREGLRMAYQKLLLHLGRLAETTRDFPAGIEALKRLLTMDRSHEEAHAGLMRLYALSGQRQFALRQYQALRDALKSELSAEPSPGTIQLFSEIQAGRMAPVLSPEARPRPSVLSAAASPSHNLPAEISSFIGREQEIQDVIQLVKKNRLVTVTGAGGIGKTRLALQVAEGLLGTFPDGVFLVKLALVTDPWMVAKVVANEIGISDKKDEDYEDILFRTLRSQVVFLILDNCEHLLEACEVFVSALLSHCPHLRVLTTSREALKVDGEALYPLQSLECPDPRRLPSIEGLKSYAAVQLFLNRAVLVRPDLNLTRENAPAIAQTCWQLDGIPLALELAAARANILSIEQIASRLNDWFHLLATKAKKSIPHHQTMVASLDWSYNLLSEPEQVLLRRLTVFAGGWTLEAAEAVCADDRPGEDLGDPAARIGPAGKDNAEIMPHSPVFVTLQTGDILDVLSHLVSRSMVTIEILTGPKGEDTLRYRFLEPIRQYALAKLERSGEAMLLRDRHLGYYLTLAESTALRAFQNQWVRQGRILKHEAENLRSALAWARSGGGTSRLLSGMRLASALRDYWEQAGLIGEGYGWMRKAFPLIHEWGPENMLVQALALQTFACLSSYQSKFQEVGKMLRESIALFQKAGDHWRQVRALDDLAIKSHADFLVYPGEALATSSESVELARQVGDPILLGITLITRGTIFQSRGNQNEAIQDWQESKELLFPLGEGAWGAACWPLVKLGGMAVEQGDLDTALRYREEYLRYLPHVEDAGLNFHAANFIMDLSYRLNDFDQMAAAAQTILDHYLGQGNWAPMWALRCLGVALKCKKEYARAADCYAQSLSMSQEVGDTHGMVMDIAGLAGIAAKLGQPFLAACLYAAVDALLETLQRKYDRFDVIEYERDGAIIREALTEKEFTQARLEGISLGLDAAIREAQGIVKEIGERFTGYTIP